MLRTVTIAALIATSLTTGAAAQSLDDVIATVNGTEITLGEALIVRMQLPEQYQSLPNDVLMQGIKEQLINQQLMADEFTDSPLRMKLALRNESRSLRAGEFIAALTATEITEEKVREVYDRDYGADAGGIEWNASHILVETEEEAAALVEEARGSASFVKLAQEHSTGPSGPNGGALGWFGDGMMVPEFQAAVADMTVGEISDPVQTQFGWHVIMLNETRVKEGPSLDEVRSSIEADLGRELLANRIEALKSDADIVMADGVDDGVIGRVDLLER